MKRISYILFLVTSRLYSQDINLKLDTVLADPAFYYKKYDLQKTESLSGEGFELLEASKLRHAFYSDRAGNSFYECGTWAISNDSIILFISDKRLVKYGYNKRESYRPILISWDLRTDITHNGEKVLVLKK